MGHNKKILVLLLSTLVFMTGGTVAVVDEFNKNFAELELLIEERFLQVETIEDDQLVVVENEDVENVKVLEAVEDSSEDQVVENKDEEVVIQPVKKDISQDSQKNNPVKIEKPQVENKVSYNEIVSYENINFNKVYKNDASLAKGSSKVESAGSLGQREIITKVTLEDNVEVSRTITSNKVIKNPKDEVVLVGTYVEPKKEVVKAKPNSIGLEKVMISEVNSSRSENNLAALRDDSRLTAAAQVRVLEIVNSFSHTRPNGERFNTVDAGWVNGENIAYGISDVYLTHSRFMASQGHRENILRSNFKSIGVASHKAENGVVYWAVLFGTK